MTQPFIETGPSPSAPFRLVACIFIAGIASWSQDAVATELEGDLFVNWGDSQDGIHTREFNLYSADRSTTVDLQISDSLIAKAGGVGALNGGRVVVETAAALESTNATDPQAFPGASSTVTVNSILLQDAENTANRISRSATSKAAGLSRRYVSILCRFADIPATPKPTTYFQNMYGSQPGELDHYWREISSSAIDLNGSTVFGWVNLPNSRGHYTGLISGTNYSPMLRAMAVDCMGEADNTIDFNSVYGLNLMFNDTFGSYAWGGTSYVSYDGRNENVPTTWNPPWAWNNITVIKHEMGHSFGLPHSNNSDGDSSPYDNPWTVMSDTWSHTNQSLIYGKLGQHLNAFEKITLGFVQSFEIATWSGGLEHYLIDPTNYGAASAGAHRMVKVPYGTQNKYYTIEVRTNGGDGGTYEGVPDTGVIIHHVDETRREPAWLVDADNPPSGSGDGDGVVWKTGEVFENAAEGVRIAIGASSGSSFSVTVGYAPNGPEFLTPQANTQLASTTQEFVWSDSGASSYWLYLGSALDRFDYFDSGNLGASTSATATNLPSDGSTIFATLWHRSNGAWLKEQTTFVATTLPEPAIDDPAPGSQLSGSQHRFSWNANGATVDAYWLYLGSREEARDYFDSGNLRLETTATVSGLPTDGRTIHATLWYLSSGTWRSVKYTYQAANSPAPTLTSPVPGTILSGESQQFQWSDNGAQVSAFWIYAGSTDGGRDYFDSGNLGLSNSALVSGLPVDGTTVHVTLWYRSSGQWRTQKATYTAASIAEPAIVSPIAGSTLSSPEAQFSWSPNGSGIQAYWLYLGSSPGARDYYDSRNLGTATSTIASGIPANGSAVFATLWYQKDGRWHTVESAYTAPSADDSHSGL